MTQNFILGTSLKVCITLLTQVTAIWMCILLSDCTLKTCASEGEQFMGMKTALYLFVDDVEIIHSRAIENGAKIEFEPADMPYEDRQSGVIDPCGNYWWISKRQVEKGYHE